jgi:YjbE family integral membrane protein
MEFGSAGFWLSVVQIIWIDILLAGDNAVVIALACRSLPPRTRMWGIVLGTMVAIVLRILFAGTITQLLLIQGLKIAGALALLWIAVDLITPQVKEREATVQSSETLWRAVRTVAIADLVMSLDNVVAIAGVAKGSWLLIAIGVAISIPLIIGGAALITRLLDRFPILVQAGAALLGWIAGEMLITDPIIVRWLGEAVTESFKYPAAIVGAVLVLAVGAWMTRIRRRQIRARELAVAEAEARGEGEAAKVEPVRTQNPV